MTASPDTLIRAEGAVIVGAGLAGLFTALKLAPLPVTVLSPVPLGEGASSAWAQGGVAAALREDDSAEAHAADTARAGAGTVDITVAAAVAEEARARIEDLIRIGAPFDRDAAGALVQSREAAHSAHRVVRVKGDTAGRAIMTSLIEAVRATPSIRVIEGVVVDDLALAYGRVAGVFARRAGDPWCAPVAVTAPAVVLATGGIGGLYEVTSNPDRVRGQGLGMAARAGAVIQDPEFVQFHPTGLDVARYPMPLASEALRGEGARLIDEAGRALMAGHDDGDLAPRDVVARTLHRHIQRGGRAFLDTREAIGAEIVDLFPTIAEACHAAGIDPVTEPIPVRPLQHYHMGGVQTDGQARSTLAGLWAVGEVACTGLHGANRLASNSLLEALVFGARAADAIREASGSAAPGPGSAMPTPAMPDPAMPDPGRADPGRADPGRAAGETHFPKAALAALRHVMSADVGVERDAAGLARALARIAEIEAEAAGAAPRGLLNMTAAATLVAAAALGREESRGGQCRIDFPETDPALAQPTRITLDTALGIRAKAARRSAA